MSLQCWLGRLHWEGRWFECWVQDVNGDAVDNNDVDVDDWDDVLDVFAGDLNGGSNIVAIDGDDDHDHGDGDEDDVDDSWWCWRARLRWVGADLNAGSKIVAESQSFLYPRYSHTWLQLVVTMIMVMMITSLMITATVKMSAKREQCLWIE